MTTALRAGNVAAVLTELLASGPTTRTAIIETTGLSPSTVTRAVEGLIEDGLAREVSLLPASGRGRRAVQLEAVSEAAVAVGVDLGAENTRISVVDLTCQLLATHRTPTPPDLDGEALARWLADLVRRTAGIWWQRTEGVAVGVPGSVDPSSRLITNAPYLPAVRAPDFSTTLTAALDRNVEIDNDANYALLGEQYFGAAREHPSAVMFTVGAGLGAGIALDGLLVRGRHGLVGEIGSLPIGPFGSRLEHQVTGRGIMLRASELGLDIRSPVDLFASDASPGVQSLRHQFDQAMIIAITTAMVAADPGIIVIGGAIANSMRGRLAHLQDAITANLRHRPTLAIAELGELSGALGACVQSLHRMYLDRGIAQSDLARLPQPRSADQFASE